MVESARATAKWDFEVLAYVDEDDPRRDGYGDVHIGPRIDLGPSYEVLRKKTNADLLMMGADDLVFRTKHWDVMVREAVPSDLICVISFDDGGNRGRREDGHPFIGRGFIELLGAITNPELKHSCIDNWVVEIAKAANRFRRLDLLIEHVHPKYGKAEWDQTYLENSPEKKMMDGKRFKTDAKKINQIAKMILSTGQC